MRESHARDFIAKPVHPKIWDEEFPEFQQLLDAMEEEVPPITLPILSPLGPVQVAPLPSSSGQKRRVARDQADMENTGASGSGGPPAKQTATDTTGTGNTETAPEHEIEEEDRSHICSHGRSSA